MGQAKINREKQRAEFLRQIEEWNFPSSQWEADLVQELQQMPVVLVHRVPAEQIAYMRMPARKCHENARWYARESKGQFRAVAGWLVDGQGAYVLHSVVENIQTGDMFCLTPMSVNVGEVFSFIPDPNFEWIEDEEANRRDCIRNGQKVHPGVRADPERVLADMATMKARLESGMNPIQAMQLG